MAVLIDTIPLRLELHEGEGNDAGKTFARGVFARGESPTANGRVYPGRLWERECGKLKTKMEQRSLFGLLDHPKDGKTALSFPGASHLITNLSYNGSDVVGEAEILPTPNGEILKKLIEAGATVGISSRGVGSTQRTGDGKQLVQDDYQLLSFDFVADPAAATAWPEFRTEDNEHLEGATMTMTKEQLQQEHGDLIREIVAEALKGRPTKEEMEQRLLSMIGEQREQALEQARSEAMSDPRTAGSNLVVESMIKLLRPYMLDEHTEQLLANKEQENKQLREDLDAEKAKNGEAQETLNELLAKMEDVSRRYYMARALNMLEDNEVTGRIFSLVGDPTRFGDNDQFKNAFRAAVEQAQTEHNSGEAENAEIARLKEERDTAIKARDKAIALGEALGARAYAEQRLSGHAHAPKLRQIMEDANPRTTKDVDAIIENWEGNNPLSPEFTDLYSRLGGDAPTNMRGGLSHLQEGMEDIEDSVLPGNGSNGQSFGIFDGGLMEEVRQLAGLPPKTNSGNGTPY